MAAAGILFVHEGLRVFRLVAPRAVHAVAPEVQEEGGALAGVDELDGFGGLAVDDVFAVRAVGDGADFVFGVCDAFWYDAVGGEVVSWRAGIGMAVEGDVEALLLRPVGLGQAQVPLADVRGAIACGFEGFCQRDLGGFQEVFAFGKQHRRIGGRGFWEEDMTGWLRWLMAGRAGDAVAGGVLTGQNGSPGRRAKWLRVGVGEAHSARGEAIDVRGLVVFGAVDAGVHPAHVIDEEEDDVGLGDGERGSEGEETEGETEHGGGGNEGSRGEITGMIVPWHQQEISFSTRHRRFGRSLSQAR